MDIPTVIFLYALLSIVALVTVVWFAIMFVVARFSEPAAYSLDGLRERLERWALPGAFIVALLAMGGSLYFSEIAHFEPCRLCWFQRIAMYPLVIILGIATWRQDAAVRVYAIPLAAIGAVIATYHYLLQWFPDIEVTACSETAPCTSYWFREFGFVSIPFLALTAFLLVITLLLIPFGEDAEGEESDGAPSAG